MLRITFIDDNGVSTKLCESTRTLAEHNFTVNASVVNQIDSLAGADYQWGASRGNRRNHVGFEVSRAEDLSGAGFATPEAALVFALDHVNGKGGNGIVGMGNSGVLKIELNSAVRYARNCLIESVGLVNAAGGICLNLRYTFTSGIISPLIA